MKLVALQENKDDANLAWDIEDLEGVAFVMVIAPQI